MKCKTRKSSLNSMRVAWNKIFLKRDDVSSTVSDSQSLLSVQLRERRERTHTMERRLTINPITANEVKNRFSQIAMDRRRRSEMYNTDVTLHHPYYPGEQSLRVLQ